MLTGPKKHLLDLIKRRGQLSIEEAIQETGVTKTTIREHLVQLERDGYLIRDYIRSGPGRPSLRYRLTEQGHNLYPSHEPSLMKEMVLFLKKRGEESTLEAFLEHFWQQRYEKAQHMMQQYGDDDQQARMDALLRMLEQEGFMPEYEYDPETGALIVRECNCPFRHLVEVTDLPCQLEAEFYRKICGGQAIRTSYIPDGDHACSYKIPGKP